jgi:hypothetical protein
VRHPEPAASEEVRDVLKTRPAKRKAGHLVALDLPYAHYLALNGGIERCGICGAEPGARRLHRDHDHRTGEPRGLCAFDATRRCGRT